MRCSAKRFAKNILHTVYANIACKAGVRLHKGTYFRAAFHNGEIIAAL